MSAPKRKATADDLRDLYGEDSHWELIDGELVERAMPRGEHSDFLSYAGAMLSRRFDRQSGGKWPGGWWLRDDLHIGYEGGEILCHDLCGFRRERTGRPAGWPILVRPDWVCEALSPKHHKRDRIEKMSILSRNRVPHYWLVDPEERLLEVYRWTVDGYHPVLVATARDVIRAEPFDAVELRAAVLFGDEDDDE